MKSAIPPLHLAVVFLFTTLTVGTASAEPIVCDLSSGGSCTINGGIFATLELQPTGSGVIDSFVRIQDKGNEQGYNTSHRPVQFDEKKDPIHTRDLLTTEVGTTMIGGVEYATFYLDLNEPASGDKELITLDQLEIFTSSSGSLSGYTGVANTASGEIPGATKVYDLDATGDSYIQLSYNFFGGGSGQSDMVFYLPVDLLSLDYVTLFSQFGGSAETAASIQANVHQLSQAGFEEWFTIAQEEVPAPEPGTIALIGIGLLSLARRLRARNS